MLLASDEDAVCKSKLPELDDNFPDPEEIKTLPPSPALLLEPAFKITIPPAPPPEFPTDRDIPPEVELDSRVLPVFSAIFPLLATDSPETISIAPELPAPAVWAESIVTWPLDAASLAPALIATEPPVLVCDAPAESDTLPPSCTALPAEN